MDGLFFYAVLIVGILLLLFFPIFFTTNAHFDISQKKVGFAVFFYGKLKIIGGYAQTYPGGIALHITKRKAVLIPYGQMESERKRFSFMKTFKPISLKITTETGAEYLLPVSLAHCFLRIYFFLRGGKGENIQNNLWLTDGDTLKISLRFTLFFNLFILLVNFLKFLKEKLILLCRKKMKKSTT